MRTAARCTPGFSLTARGRFACAVFGDDVIAASGDNGATWRAVPLETAPGAGLALGPGAAPRPHIGSTLRYRCVPDGQRLLVAGNDGLYAVTAPW